MCVNKIRDKAGRRITINWESTIASPNYLPESLSDASALIYIVPSERRASHSIRALSVHVNKALQGFLPETIHHSRETLNSIQEDVGVVIL